MAEIRVEQKRSGAGRWILLTLLLLALAAAAYWFFVMNGGSVDRADTAPADTAAPATPPPTSFAPDADGAPVLRVHAGAEGRRRALA